MHYITFLRKEMHFFFIIIFRGKITNLIDNSLIFENQNYYLENHEQKLLMFGEVLIYLFLECISHIPILKDKEFSLFFQGKNS